MDSFNKYKQLFGACDAVVIYDENLRRYLTNFKSSFGIVVLSQKNNYFFTDKRYITAVKKQVKNFEVLDIADKDEFIILKELNITKVGLALSKIFADKYLEYINKNFKVVDITENIQNFNAIKTDEQITSIKRSCKIADTSFKKLLPYIKEGITERELANNLEKLMRLCGGESTSFETIVAFQKNSSIPHHETGDCKLKNGSVILIDFGAKFNGFCSDMTRTIYFGTPTKCFVDDYTNVLNAHKIAKNNITNNISAGLADGFAREFFKTKGLDNYFTHSLGHGLGFEIHEAPYLKVNSRDILKDNMVFTIEPGIYKKNYGIRIEDTVLLSDGKVESLIKFTKNLVYIEDNKLKTLKII